TKNRTNLMVFLRPVVLRDAAAGDRLSLDRYEQIRAQQKDGQPVHHPMLPLQDSPVLPPVQPPVQPPVPAPGPTSAPSPGGVPQPLAPASPSAAPPAKP
ncbi:MAG: type II secretion system secretin GspD, partial [Rubrivivax sp.]